MPPRRTHTKSRNGCAKCKRRRVKCDEVHPACGNCIKHAIECDFSSIQSPNSFKTEVESTSEGSTTKNSPSTIREDSSPIPIHEPCLSSALIPAVGVTPGFISQPRLALSPASFQEWSMMDMELMHHFTVMGPDFLASNESMHDVWRVTVPKLAFNDNSGCAMHAILAVTSLHLAFLEPEKRSARVIKARAHYDQAVRVMSSLVPRISRENCEPLFISASLIVVFATASPLLPGYRSTENEPWALPEWIPLIRGVHSILKEARGWVEAGCLSKIIKVSIWEAPEEITDEIDEAINSLYRLCTDTSEPYPEEILDTDISSTYFGAIHQLRKCFANWSTNLKRNTVSMMFLWPIGVSDRYVALLKEKRPRALIIFAYYCVLLKLVEAHWWVGGRAEYELARIERSIQEMEKWKKWFEWPTKMVWGTHPA